MLAHGEKIRKAIRWISQALQEESGANLKSLINEAGSKFDLNPKESEELSQFYRPKHHKP